MILGRKLSRTFYFFCLLKQHSNGYIEVTNEVRDYFNRLVGWKSRNSFDNNIRRLQQLGFVGVDENSNKIYLRSFKRILKQYNIRTTSFVEYEFVDIEHHKHFRALLFSSVLAKEINTRRYTARVGRKNARQKTRGLNRSVVLQRKPGKHPIIVNIIEDTKEEIKPFRFYQQFIKVPYFDISFGERFTTDQLSFSLIGAMCSLCKFTAHKYMKDAVRYGYVNPTKNVFDLLKDDDFGITFRNLRMSMPKYANRFFHSKDKMISILLTNSYEHSIRMKTSKNYRWS